MKWKMLACTSLLVPVLGLGQAKSGSSQMDRPRSSYDPAAAAGVRRDQPGVISSALAKVNPGDKDYGEAVSEGRIAVIEETVEDFYWWSCMVLTVLLTIATVYIMWLLQQRQLRLSISGDIVAQLYNSHVAARSKAFEAIDAYNQLVRRYNARAAEIAALREAIEQKEGALDAKQGIEAAGKLHSKGPKQNGEEPEAVKAVSAPGVVPVRNDIHENASTDPGIEDVESLKERLQKVIGQNKANEQKIVNLRTQLTRAHHSLEDARGKAPSGRQG